jgi:dimethylargininase
MRIAITRQVSPNINQCELTHIERQPIDYDLAVAQHAAYENALRKAGCEVFSLPPEPAFPDSVFVEDAAVVFDEVAVIARPGAESRRSEIPAISEVLAAHRPMAQIVAPGELDGGDVLVIGRKVFVGLSKRTNLPGFQQLSEILRPFGYYTLPIPLEDCLHLKSAVTRVAPNLLLINGKWVDPGTFLSFVRAVEVDRDEPLAANALLVGDRVIYPASYPMTTHRLHLSGVRVEPVDVSELSKAEGGVTCCSIVFET